MREFILDRYHNGVLMAMGAKVDAESLEDAIYKAKALFPNEPFDKFKERTEWTGAYKEDWLT